MKSKTITIEESQAKWVEENCINLSKYVRACIERSIAGDPYEDTEAISASELHEGMFKNDEVKTGGGGRV